MQMMRNLFCVSACQKLSKYSTFFKVIVRKKGAISYDSQRINHILTYVQHYPNHWVTKQLLTCTAICQTLHKKCTNLNKPCGSTCQAQCFPTDRPLDRHS